ncbi:hypothetical protein [Streptomyces collinus]|uniref:hypothetical protein n=1 Tax=Streptomyces collinus TaxID=42684 RepID=UPI002941DE79|nr:hypothetical protein [Streptomyces collinus]
MSVARLRSPLGVGRATVTLLGLVMLSDVCAVGAGLEVRRTAHGLAAGASMQRSKALAQPILVPALG